MRIRCVAPLPVLAGRQIPKYLLFPLPMWRWRPTVQHCRRSTSSDGNLRASTTRPQMSAQTIGSDPSTPGHSRMLADTEPVSLRSDVSEAPAARRIDVEFVDSTEVPVGLGEPGTTVVDPAIGNAIFAAVGARLRHLPILPAMVLQSLTP